jgi:Fe-S cluster assembly protein SufD
MKHFTSEASASLGGPDWLRRRRGESRQRLDTMTQPTADSAEVWRYSPIDRLDLDAYRPAGGGGETAALEGAAALADEFEAGARLIVHNGRVVSSERDGLPGGVALGGAAVLQREDPALGTLSGDNDFFVVLNDSFVPDLAVVDIAPRVVLDRPIVIVHWCDGGAPDGPAPCSFPRTLVRLGEDAEAQVVEVIAGSAEPARALVVPVTEMVVGDRARLAYVMMQDLGRASWQLGRLGATVGRDGTFTSFTAGLGAEYDRCRLDVSAAGQGSSTAVTSVYLGSGDQIHDVRTLQDHRAPHTVSDLLCKGAVAERSRSIYSGLIRMRHGAVRSDAMQTNHNLVLDESAHADSVPNLDIEENDVRCSHASSVGPVSEDQLYYLESRGLAPERAERLIVLGFFDDIVERAPIPAARRALRGRIGRSLGTLLEGRESPHE